MVAESTRIMDKHKRGHFSAIQREKNFRDMGAHVPDRYMGSYYSSPNSDLKK